MFQEGYTDVQNLEASLGPIDLASILTTAENAEEGTLCIDYDLSFSDETNFVSDAFI